MTLLDLNVTLLSVALFATLTQNTKGVLEGTQKADWETVWAPWVKFQDFRSK